MSHAPLVQPELAPPGVDQFEPRHIGEQALNFSDAYTEHTATVGQTFLLHEHVAAQALGEARRAKVMEHLAIEEMRKGFAGLDASQKDIVGGYLEKLIATDETPNPALANPDWLATRASDKDLLRLATLQRREMERLRNDPRVRVEIERVKHHRLLVEEQAIAQGWVSPRARDTAHKVRDIQVTLGDIAHVAHQYAGWYMPGSTWLGLSQDSAVGEAGVQALLDRIDGEGHGTLGHELNHVQFFHGLPRWEEEAMAEHVDLGFHDRGAMAIMDPQQRVRHDLLERNRLPAMRRLKHIELTAGLPMGDDHETTMVRYAVLAYTSGSLDSLESKVADGMIDASWRRKNMRQYVTDLVEECTALEAADLTKRMKAARKAGHDEATIATMNLSEWQLEEKGLKRAQERLLAEGRALREKHGTPTRNTVSALPQDQAA